MEKQLSIVLIIFSPLFSLAGENDSLSIQTVTSNTSDSGSIAVLDSTLAIENDSILIEEKVYLSYDIVPFDMNEIPVDADLFNYHVSTREFQVPMDYNLLVKKQIDYFGTRWQVRLKEMVTKSQYFFPLYEEILSEYDLPLEIKYLSIIESGLNPYAKSRSGAMGAWQFMPATGKIFNLKVSSKVDERRSLEKSTRAACIYLKQMYNLYDDWLVALASYNCGPGNVRKAIRLSGRKDFWGIYNYLPRETQNYVPKFIAMTYMMNFYEDYGIVPAPYEAEYYRYQQVYCQEGLDFGIIAEKIGLSKEELLKYNPEMKVGEIPYKGDGYTLNIPKDMAYLFYDNQDEILAISSVLMEERRLVEASKPEVVYYYVKKGESLPIIARRQGCTVSQLKQWNGIRGSLIYPKQRLKIYRI
ncbi:transglycosylase SLT domain-containing protein [Bacteroidia bacterium]|nr:transglycosylase SLT domain-containing protein [Bacteroidia bacterium]